MRNLDSCRCWRCTLCLCKVRNTFLVNFWNHYSFVYSLYLNLGLSNYKGRLNVSLLLWDSSSAESVTGHYPEQINLRLHPVYLLNFIRFFHHKMDVWELSDVKWQRFVVRNWRLADFQSVHCAQKAEIKGVWRDNKNEAIKFSIFTTFKVKVWWPFASSGDSKHFIHWMLGCRLFEISWYN